MGLVQDRQVLVRKAIVHIQGLVLEMQVKTLVMHALVSGNIYLQDMVQIDLCQATCVELEEHLESVQVATIEILKYLLITNLHIYGITL